MFKALMQQLPHEALLASTDDDREEFQAVANSFATATTPGVMWSLGTMYRAAVPGEYQLGGLVLVARILPLRHGIRREKPSRMAIMVSLNVMDTIDVTVTEIASGREHVRVRDVYIDQLQRVMLALDFDGREPLNPRYWS